MSVPADQRAPEELRRRLYRPSASDEDLLRYRAAMAALPPSPPDPPSARIPRPRAAARVLGAAVLGAGLAAGLFAASTMLTRSDGRSVAPTAAATPVATVGPGSPRDLIVTVTDDGQSFSGVGPGTVRIDPTGLSFHAGRVRVAMTSTLPATAGWSIERIETRQDWSSFPRALARGRAVAPADPPAPLIFEYIGAPPASARIRTASDARWTLDLRFVMR